MVNQQYDPEVQNPAAFIGSNVLMKCNIPTFVKDYVSVISWLQEPSFNIYPATESGKYRIQKYLIHDCAVIIFTLQITFQFTKTEECAYIFGEWNKFRMDANAINCVLICIHFDLFSFELQIKILNSFAMTNQTVFQSQDKFSARN